MIELIKKKLPVLNDSELLKEIEKVSSLVFITEGDTLIKKGSYPKFIPLILEGIIKVNRIDDDGNEIFLYYLTSGQSCSMTLACCSTYTASKLSATVEEEATIIKIPIASMDEWMGKYSSWRSFIFNSLNNRITSLLESIDQIAFSSLDERLLNLLEKMSDSKKTKELKITHQGLATELNTSREVISRLLKKLEEQKMLTLGRNKITLLS